MDSVTEMLKMSNISLINLREIPDCCGSCVSFDGTANIYDQGNTICNKSYCDTPAFSRPCGDYRRVFEYSQIIDYCTEEVREKLGIKGCEDKCRGMHIYKGGKRNIRVCPEILEKSSKGDLIVHLLKQEIAKT